MSTKVDDECPNCGSTFSDRERKAKSHFEDDVPTGLIVCEFCGTKKCCMCDMGNDVSCLSCENIGP